MSVVFSFHIIVSDSRWYGLHYNEMYVGVYSDSSKLAAM